VRIGIVNDVPAASEVLRRIISDTQDNRVAWIARDGAEAVEKCREDTPDLVLMDLIMPVMDGVEATRRIMIATPCAILVVTATIDGNSSKVFEALSAGALDAVQTPSTGANSNALKFKIETFKRQMFPDAAGEWKSAGVAPQPFANAKERLVAIGASAGGPAAVATILSGLPRDFASRVIVIQHIDAQFVPSMVTWLNQQSKMPVRIARQGERPEAGVALVAGTNDHLAFINSDALGYTAEPTSCSYRPSVDVFFESVVRYWKGEVVGVLLSGMGRDGAHGLKSLRDSGAVTIAQDSATSAVYGMPKAAAELRAAVKILPVHEIAGELLHRFTGQPFISQMR
jgi:chemotaxis response regulator CheB